MNEYLGVIKTKGVIAVIKLKNFEPRTIEFDGLRLDMFPTKDEALGFASAYEYGKSIEIRVNGIMVEKVNKPSHI